MVSYKLLLVSSNDDLVIVQHGACIECVENKLGCQVIKRWDIEKETVIKCKKQGYITSLYKIKCQCY